MVILNPVTAYLNLMQDVQMTRANNHAILLLVTALVLLWSFQARGELVKLRAEGRIDKVDAIESTDPGIKVGATFAFELSYDSQMKGTILVRGLSIDSVAQLTKLETFFCEVNHSSKAGAWDRLRLLIEHRKDSIVDGSSSSASFNVKVALDSSTNGDLDPSATRQHSLDLNGLNISLGDETFFHLVYSDSSTKRGLAGLISGEVISLTRVDD